MVKFRSGGSKDEAEARAEGRRIASAYMRRRRQSANAKAKSKGHRGSSQSSSCEYAKNSDHVHSPSKRKMTSGASQKSTIKKNKSSTGYNKHNLNNYYKAKNNRSSDKFEMKKSRRPLQPLTNMPRLIYHHVPETDTDSDSILNQILPP